MIAGATMMRTRVWVAVLIFGWGAGVLAGQTTPAGAADPMAGMDMGQEKTASKDAAKPMDMEMCRKMCKCMDMEMGNNKSKGMDMNMDMGKEKSMSMGMGHDMKMDQAKPGAAAGPLKITFGDKSAEWTAAALAALPHTTLTVFNAHTKANQTYTGVALIELLAKLGVPDKPHGGDLRLYLVAVGADGYEAVYSLAEINPDVHDGTVIVADTLDGKGLAASGPLQLVATGEKRPARWVRNLVAIRVLTAQ